MRLRGTIWLCGLVALLLVGCGLGQERVLLESDGARRWFPIGEAETVAELLRGAQVELGARDRVEPPSYTLLEPEQVIRVFRVRERTVEQEQTLPFGREVRRDATLPVGQSRLLQLGQNGRERLTLRLLLEDEVEIEREVVERVTLVEPQPEILVIGTQGAGEPVSFEGTIIYMQGGNAWRMRGNSGEKEALTRTGDLDGHVFSLSPDGRWLLFSREPLGGASGQGGPLNTLWLLDVRVINEEPRSLDLSGVLWADWQPCPTPASGCPLQVAFSEADRVPTPPGWRARNNLRRFLLNDEGLRGDDVPLAVDSSALLGWWGREWAWAPDGRTIAWADATRVGLLDVATGFDRLLLEFLPFETLAAWVWTPQLAWAPDGRTLLATVHASADSGERGERFDLWQIPIDGEPSRLVEGVGPFAMPRWLDGDRYIYGQAEDPELSLTSRYDIRLQRSGAAPRTLFPSADQPGLDVPWSAWNREEEALVVVWQGDLWLVPLAPLAQARALTSEGGASRPQWGP